MSVVWTDIAVFKCPACGEKARLDGVQPFHKRLREQEPFGCPLCGHSVTWASMPTRIFRLGEWLLLAGFAPIFISGFAFWSVPIFAVAGAFLCAGMLTQHLVPSDRLQDTDVTSNKLRWSDAWLLLATYYSSTRGEHRLRGVIAAADAMEHAVMNFEEVSSGMVRLVEHGLIAVQSDPWRLTCTERGLEVVVPAAARKASMHQVRLAVESALDAEPWNKDALPHPANWLRYLGFSKEDHDREVQEYLGHELTEDAARRK